MKSVTDFCKIVEIGVDLRLPLFLSFFSDCMH